MKKKKQTGEEMAFNRRDITKGQHGSSKLHRISKKLPAATLAAFGRCRGRQGLTNTDVASLSLMCPFELAVSISVYYIYRFYSTSPWRIFWPDGTTYCNANLNRTAMIPQVSRASSAASHCLWREAYVWQLGTISEELQALAAGFS